KPAEFVVTARTSPVARFLIEICAFGMTAPEASLTVPVIVAPDTWAFTQIDESRTVASATHVTRNMAIVFGSLCQTATGGLSFLPAIVRLYLVLITCRHFQHPA